MTMSIGSCLFLMLCGAVVMTLINHARWAIFPLSGGPIGTNYWLGGPAGPVLPLPPKESLIASPVQMDPLSDEELDRPRDQGRARMAMHLAADHARLKANRLTNAALAIFAQRIDKVEKYNSHSIDETKVDLAVKDAFLLAAAFTKEADVYFDAAESLAPKDVYDVHDDDVSVGAESQDSGNR